MSSEGEKEPPTKQLVPDDGILLYPFQINEALRLELEKVASECQLIHPDEDYVAKQGVSDTVSQTV